MQNRYAHWQLLSASRQLTEVAQIPPTFAASMSLADVARTTENMLIKPALNLN